MIFLFSPVLGIIEAFKNLRSKQETSFSCSACALAFALA